MVSNFVEVLLVLHYNCKIVHFYFSLTNILTRIQQYPIISKNNN